MTKAISSSRPLTRRERHFRALHKRYETAQKRAAMYYELADYLAFKLAEELGGHGKMTRTHVDGRGIEVIDNYKMAIAETRAKLQAGKITNPMPKAWGHGSVRQYEFKEVAVLSP